MIPFVLIASIASVTFVALAAVAHVPTYRVAPALLVPTVWGMVLLRRRLHLHPVHFLLFAAALALHMLGALGYYQRGFLGISFDVYVHTYFAFATTLLVHRFLARTLPLGGWSLALATLLCVMGFGGIHEVMEYGSYLALGEERGMLKSTGYRFDTSRDLTSNFVGCVAGLLVIALSRAFTAGQPGTMKNGHESQPSD